MAEHLGGIREAVDSEKGPVYKDPLGFNGDGDGIGDILDDRAVKLLALLQRSFRKRVPDIERLKLGKRSRSRSTSLASSSYPSPS